MRIAFFKSASTPIAFLHQATNQVSPNQTTLQ